MPALPFHSSALNAAPVFYPVNGSSQQRTFPKDVACNVSTGFFVHCSMALKLSRLPYLLFLLLTLVFVQANAQVYPIRNYTIQDGLPSNTVYCVYKDSKGALWFGTDKGIARYNGVRFEKFSTADGLPDNEIFCFGEDKYNRLWMGTFNGSLCYYKDGIIHTAVNTPFLKLPAKYPFIFSIFNEYDGSVTICFSNSTYFLNIIGEKVHLYNIASLKEDSWRMRQIVKRSPAQYEILYKSFAYLWDTSGKSIHKTIPDSLAVGYISNDQRYLISDHEIIRNDTAICKIPPASGGMKTQGMLEDKERHQIMMCTSKGLLILPQNKFLFPGHVVSSATKDASGNYWVTTTDEGIFCLNAGYEHFGIFNNPDKTRIIYARIIHNQLYFTTQNNNIYTLKNDTVKKLFDGYAFKDEIMLRTPNPYLYYIDFGHYETMPTAARRRLEYRDLPAASYLDTNLQFYHFSSWDCLILDQLQTNKARVAEQLPMYTAGCFKNMAVTDSAVYLQGFNDIVYLPKTVIKSHDFSQVRLLKSNPEKHERFFGWAKDSEGNVWVSTVDSLYKIEKDKIIVQPEYGAIGLRKFSLLNGFLIGYKHDNTLLISHLEQQNPVTDTIIHSASIWDGFYQIDSSHIIISSSDKYYMVALTKPGAKNGFHIQPIASRFIPPQTEYICADSTSSYFFKNGTIVRLDTKHLFDVSSKPVVYFVSLRTKDSIYAANQNTIDIPYRETGDLQISYLPLSFGGGDLQCEYSISQNESNDWHTIDETTIHLYLAHYGTYYIRVRAKEAADSYSDTVTFQLNILKPFWATWWFITLVIIAALILAWMIIIFITRRVLRRRQKDYEADMKYQKMEFKALNALMNPHFIFNTLNNIQNLFKNQQNKADEYFVTFSRLIRQNMQNVTKDTISLEQELNLVANYLKLEKLRFAEFVNYTMDVDPELDLDNVFIPPLLIQPLVENSIRHGLLPKESPQNQVTVRVYEKGQSLFVEVEDNGIGLKGKSSHIDPQHESLGLSNLRKRIEHMNRTHREVITFNLVELKGENGRVKGTLASIEISSARW
ncbi:sensor histidine kinase [Taibaiella soli]|nr:histidine kinase [Taibaiella soli]